MTLFLWEGRKGERVSSALWLPVLWITIAGSRFVGQWMDLGQAPAATAGDGSFIDALYFSILIVAGCVVLIRRRIDWHELMRKNWWLVAFFLYSFLSILWSDFSFIAFKRYIKVLGHPIMALIILTDPDANRALRIVMKRCAYIMMPLSVLFIKYFPEIGRNFDPWSGLAFNRGVALTKSELGYLCMIFGIFFYWHVITIYRRLGAERRLLELVLGVVFLGIALWLLKMAGSATALVTLVIGVGIIALLGLDAINKRFLGAYAVLTILAALIIESTFGVYAGIIEMLGRDPTLTDRTVLWEDVLGLVENSLLGAGFESFWLGVRQMTLWEKWWWRPNQAHNGYIETYLNLGLIGLFILVGLIVSTFRRITQQFRQDEEFARLRMGFLVAILAYNFVEATFKGVHVIWTIFHIIAIQCPPSCKKGRQPYQRQRTAESCGSEASNRHRAPHPLPAMEREARARRP
ncbi:O-antigen ligase family protein [Thioalkalicoccus limnaeus]